MLKLKNKKSKQLLECLFGYHKYSKVPSIDITGNLVNLCKYCKKNSKSRSYDEWSYNENNEPIHYRNFNGCDFNYPFNKSEKKYDEQGRIIYYKSYYFDHEY